MALISSNPAWFLSDLDKIEKRDVRVLSTFSCGGGSSMGYKLAGCSVVAANDIDERMAENYRRNLGGTVYVCPINQLAQIAKPEDIEDIDILDGSPPCSTFSMSGNREKDWGKNKKFREGQATQVLSDLFFEFIALAKSVRPKVIIAENVKGLIMGNAKGYLKAIVRDLESSGWKTQVFLVNAADCGVPQRRERVFVCACLAEMKPEPLRLSPRKKHISAGDALKGISHLTKAEKEKTKLPPFAQRAYPQTKPGDSFSKAMALKTGGKSLYFGHTRLSSSRPSHTIISGSAVYHWSEARTLCFREIKRLGSFPDDYAASSETEGHYLVGTSVPPRMMEYIAGEVCRQWLGK